MKRIFTILFAIVFLLPASKAGELYFTQQQAPLSDTTEDEKKEDALIYEVIKTKAVPTQDKVQYFSQVTKYGFKNLFSKYSYNTSLAYSAQVNPSATSFIGDYMKSHSNYLTKM